MCGCVCPTEGNRTVLMNTVTTHTEWSVCQCERKLYFRTTVCGFTSCSVFGSFTSGWSSNCVIFFMMRLYTMEHNEERGGVYINTVWIYLIRVSARTPWLRGGYMVTCVDTDDVISRWNVQQDVNETLIGSSVFWWTAEGSCPVYEVCINTSEVQVPISPASHS